MSGIQRMILIWLGLLVLLALTVAASFVLTGAASLITGLGIAFAKAALIFWFYMHLREEGWLNRMAAIGVLAWLTIMLLLSATDYAMRATS